MRSSFLAAAAPAAAFLLGGCAGLLQEDETVGWSAQKLYGEARDAIAAKDYARAVKYLEKLEARYPYGRYAQQAQLEIAYANWKDGERAAARHREGGGPPPPPRRARPLHKVVPNPPHGGFPLLPKGAVQAPARGDG